MERARTTLGLVEVVMSGCLLTVFSEVLIEVNLGFHFLNFFIFLTTI